jgi:tryptophan 2,3-dioxygenase
MNDLTYVSYLKISDLLQLQKAQSDPEEHDELLFIVIHQVYELWFKLMLHELEKVRDDMGRGDLWPAVATWKRLRTIMKTLVEQVDIVETLTPMSFGSFRDRLDTASGFQSPQFREIEYLLGYKRPDMVKHQPDSEFRAKLEKRLKEPSINDALYKFLEHHGVEIPEDVKNRDITARAETNERVEEQLLVLYKNRRDMEILFESMTDFDEGFQEWRYRHIKLVERTIGSKKGTGGSLGIEFLKKSLFMPVFPDLWAIRHRL